MAQENLTSIVFVIDRSGSMANIAASTEDALKEFVGAQKALDGELTIDTVFFDDKYEERAVFVNPKTTDVDFTLQPRGMTALYDAVGKKINSFSQKLEATPEALRPAKVLFIIATDGHENSSHEYTQAAVAKLIEDKRTKDDWQFTFIGANQDAVLTAKNLNIGAEHAITFAATDVGASSVIRSMSTYAGAYRAGSAAAFTDEDREAAQKS